MGAQLVLLLPTFSWIQNKYYTFIRVRFTDIIVYFWLSAKIPVKLKWRAPALQIVSSFILFDDNSFCWMNCWWRFIVYQTFFTAICYNAIFHYGFTILWHISDSLCSGTFSTLDNVQYVIVIRHSEAIPTLYQRESMEICYYDVGLLQDVDTHVLNHGWA